MARSYWLMKSEPFKYSFAQLVREGRAMWDGVRNFEARNNMRAMKAGEVIHWFFAGACMQHLLSHRDEKGQRAKRAWRRRRRQ